MNALIQPAWACYTLTAAAATTGSPARPAVRLGEREAFGGEWIRDHTLTPQQARDLADMLTAAADEADGTAARNREHSAYVRGALDASAGVDQPPTTRPGLTQAYRRGHTEQAAIDAELDVDGGDLLRAALEVVA
jgi:hypothetical protein